MSSDPLQVSTERLCAQAEWLCLDARLREAEVAAAVLRRWRGEALADLTPAHLDALGRLALACLARGPMGKSSLVVSMPVRLQAVAAGEGTLRPLLEDVLTHERANAPDPRAAELRTLLADVPPLETLWSLRGPELAFVLRRTHAALASEAGAALLDAIADEVAASVMRAAAERAPLADAAAYLARVRRRVPEAALNAAHTAFAPEVLADSLADLDAALTLEPENHQALVLRARTRLLTGGAEARLSDELLAAVAADLTRAQALGATASGWSATAELHAARRDFTAAEAAASRALELDPSATELLAKRGVYRLELDDVDGAAADGRAAIAAHPEHPAGWWIEARVLTLRGELPGALTRFEHALTLAPDHAASFLARSRVFEAMGDLPRALADANRGVELSGAATAFYNRGNLHLAMQAPRLAEADFSRALDANPSDYQAALNRSVARLHLQNFLGAIEDLRLAMALVPENPVPPMKLGLLLLQAGDRPAGVAALERALQLAPPDWEHRAVLEQTVAAFR